MSASLAASLAVVNDHEKQQQQQQQQQQHNDEGFQQQEPQPQQELHAAQLALKYILFSGYNSRAREQVKLHKALQILETFPSLAQMVWEDMDYCLAVSTTPFAYFARQINRLLAASACSLAVKQPPDESSSWMSMLQRVYDIYPPAIETPNLRGRLPLHEACSFLAVSPDTHGTRHPVLEFLIERFPAGASHADHSGQYPFHHALQQCITAPAMTRQPQKQQVLRDTLERLLDLYPAVLEVRDFGGYLPLERALKEACHGVLQLLLERSVRDPAYALPCPAGEDLRHEDHDAYHNSRRSNNNGGPPASRNMTVRTTLEVAQSVAVLFSRLDSFAALGSQWTVEGMHSLLQSLGSSTSTIQDLTLRLPRGLFEKSTTAQQQQQQQQQQQEEEPPHPSSTLLELLLQQAQCSTSSSRLRQVSFFGQAIGSRYHQHHNHHVQDFGYDNPAFESIRNGIVNHTNTQRLVELHLHQFRLGTDCRTGVSPVALLQSLLFSPQAPRRIGLTNIVVEGGHWFGTGTTPIVARPKAVFEELMLQHLTGDWVYHLLQDLAVVSSPLKKLTLDSCRTLDNSHNGDDQLALLKPIAKILETSKLECLTVRGLHATHVNSDLLQQQNQYLELTRALTRNTHLIEYCVHHTSMVPDNDRTSQQQQQQQQQRRGKDSASFRSKIKADLVDILEAHNTTLRDVRVTFVELGDDQVRYTFSSSTIEMEQDRQIDQFTQLNRFGRKEARTLDTAKERFVQLLANVTAQRTVGESGCSTKTLTTENEHNVQYNLLRETPSIWCGYTSRRSVDDNDAFAVHRRKRPKQANLPGDEHNMTAYS